MSLDAPSKIGKYDVLALLGRGGMGIVYKAMDPLLGRPVAIKMITGVHTDDSELLNRFFREAQSTASLQHPNIVTVYELGDHGGSPYLVMEYLEGESLDSIMNSGRPLNLIDKIGFVIDVCHGLSYAHQRAIVHRDIKPANIMILKDGSVKIVDFGIAHIGNQTLTRTGFVMGSPNYMSPEQVSGVRVDFRSDLFSTGVVLYQALTSALPFDGPTTASILYKIVHESPAPIKSLLASCPSDLEDIVLRALAKEREERYPSAADFAFELEQVQQRLKHEAVDQHLQDVSALLEQGNLYHARDRLQLILTVDRRHAQASQLLRDVALRIQQQEVRQEAQKLRAQAEEALAAASFEAALAYVDRAIGIAPNDAELLGLRDSIRAALAREEKLHQAIEDAQLAHHNGNLESARRAAERALGIAPNDTRARALFQIIQSEWAERLRQIELQKHLADARTEITARRFAAALEFLKLAEALDANAPEVRVLRETAGSGREQESRRVEQQGINREIEEALERSDYVTACRKADEGIKGFPEERAFHKLKQLAEKQRQIAERKQFVDAQLSLSRTLLDAGRGEELLAVLESALEKAGQEPRLESLLLIVRENVRRERIEQRKTEFINRAKDALHQKQHAQAIRVLEEGRTELKDAPEIEELLLFAREQADAQERRDVVDDAAHKAHDFLAQQEYDEAINVLEAALRQTNDDQLSIILTEARRAARDHQLSLDNTLRTARRLIQADRAAEALNILESQSAVLARDPAFQRLLDQARDEAEHFANIQEAINRSRLASEKDDYQLARRLLEDCQRRFGSAHNLKQQFIEIAEKETAAATAVVKKTIRVAYEFAGSSDFKAALDELASASNLTTLVSPSLKSEYEECQKQCLDALAQQRKREIHQRMSANDYTYAEELLRDTLVQFPGTREFLATETNILKETGPRSEAQQALIASEECFERHEWKQAGEFLQKAFRAGQHLPPIRQKALSGFLRGAELALPDWQAAETLLKQLAGVQPDHAIPPALQTRIQLQRKEDSVIDCLKRAEELQRAGSLHGAVREIAEGVATYPNERRLLDFQKAISLKIQQEEERNRLDQSRRERETFVQNAVQRALEEPDPERRVLLLEDAAAKYPDDSALERVLREARDLRQRVTAIMQEVRFLEDAGKYGEALTKWNALRDVHAQHPELDRGIARISTLVEMARSTAGAAAIQKVHDALASANYDRAAKLLADAKQFWDHPDIADLGRRLQESLQARDRAQGLIADGHKAFFKKNWTKGAGYLQRAVDLATRDLVVREQVTSELLRACASALETDIAAAESLLKQASELQPAFSLLAPLKARIDHVRRIEHIDRTLVNAARLRKAGDLPAALQEIEQALCEDPDNDRLLQLQNEIERQLQNLEEDARRTEQLEGERLRQSQLSSQRVLERQKREAALARARFEEAEKEQARLHQAELDRKRLQAEILEAETSSQRGTEQADGAENATGIFGRNQTRLAHSGPSVSAELEPDSALREAATDFPAGQLPSTAGRGAPKWQYLTGISLGVIVLIFIAVWLHNSTSKGIIHPTFNFQITTTPPGAIVRIRNTDRTCVTPKCIFPLEAGNYEAVAELLGHETSTQRFSVSASGVNSLSISLPEKPARLEIRGLKPAEEIFIDGRPQGQVSPDGNFSKYLPGGSHEIKWIANDHTSGSTFRRIPPGETVTVSANDFSPVGSRDPSETAWLLIQGTNQISDLEGYGTLYPKNAHKAELERNLDKLYWQKAEASSQVEDVEAYLRRFPNGSYRTQADSRREQLYWQIAKNDRAPADLQKYLHLFRDGPHVADITAILEDLDWQHAREANTISAFNDYLGKYRSGQHAAEARQNIDGLEFRQIENSTSVTTLEEFLEKHKSGSYHDQIYFRLDDLTWTATDKQDSASLHVYAQKFPNGRYIGEANKNIGRLSSQGELHAVKLAIERYRDAYESESPGDMKKAWPGISKEQSKRMTELFNTVSAIKVRITCLDSDIHISAQQASAICHQTARYTQRGTVMPEQPSDVNIMLNQNSDKSWVIEAIVSH